MNLNSTRFLFFACLLGISQTCFSQSASCTLTATTLIQESTCKATGSITVNVSNGSGNYNYILTGNGYNTTTSSNTIGGLPAGKYNVKVKDIVSGCTLKLDSSTVPGTYQDPRFQLLTTDLSCFNGNNGAIMVTNLQFGKGPFAYSIIAPSASGVGTVNSTGVFTSLPAGLYTIQLRDSCGGIQTRLATINNYTWSITATAVTKSGCDSADVNITLADNHGNTNNSGMVFSGFLYGFVRGAGDTVWNTASAFRFKKGKARSVVFVIKDLCGNENTSSWTDVAVPKVSSTVGISNRTCSNFTATVNNQRNLTNPQFCLYDNSNTLITCNTTGVFPGLAYGSYCIYINDACYDTTFSRCFSVLQGKPALTGVTYSNTTCTDFTVTAGGNNLTNSQYCLYDGSGNLVSCDSTGVFNNLTFGNYCIHVQNDRACYDTALVYCFTNLKPIPGVNNSVSISNKACAGFTASLKGQTNLTNPQFCLYDNSNNQLICNTTGQFNNLSYGSYCIKMQNDPSCYDTLITRCFSVAPSTVTIGVTATASCTIGATDVSINLSNGTAPYTITVYNDLGTVVSTTTTSSNSTTLNALPVTHIPAVYKMVVAGSCGSLDSTSFNIQASTFTHTLTVTSQCPSGLWANGSGNLAVNAVFSNGPVTPKLVRQDGAVVSIAYSGKSGSVYTFSTLAPATYIIQYSLQGCSNLLYDTFQLKPYQYPALDQSAIYQCNNNSFSVNAVAVGGMLPYTYEIIGSQPASPSIIAPPQASPVFGINNNQAYSVVRLRAIDACGNATINDASILPLGNTVVSASSNCFYNNVSLAVDTIPNSTYLWYKRTAPADSVLVGNTQSYEIDNLLPSDTGTYVSVVSVNAGCLTKISSFNVNGGCTYSILALNNLSFSGSAGTENIQLHWLTTQDFEADRFMIERSGDGKNFKQIGSVSATEDNTAGPVRYNFTDLQAGKGNQYYRLRIIKAGKPTIYSKVIEIGQSGKAILTVMPNPVAEAFVIQFQQMPAGFYTVSLVSGDGKRIFSEVLSTLAGESHRIERPAHTPPGIYYLQVRNNSSNAVEITKLFFK